MSARVHEDPYPTYASLRDEHPLYLDPGLAFFALSRHADISAALKDWRTFSSAGGAVRGGDLMDMDPPRHTPMRKLLAPRLGRDAAAGLACFVRSSAARLLDASEGRSELDLATEFAHRLPVLTMCRVLGIAERDTAPTVELALALRQRPSGGSGADPLRARGALAELFLGRISARIAGNRTDDLFGDLARSVEAAEIDHTDLVGLCLTLVVAGMEPTSSLLTNAIHALATGRVSRRQICEEDRRVRRAAISEFLRHDSPVQWVSRTTTRTVTFHGQAIPPGRRVLLLIGSANRDPRRFPDPDAFEVGRDGTHSIAFGAGAHACLGSSLARLQARLALEAVLERFRCLSLAGPAVRAASRVLRGYERLPVAVDR